jgi:hypothetical protein
MATSLISQFVVENADELNSPPGTPNYRNTSNVDFQRLTDTMNAEYRTTLTI